MKEINGNKYWQLMESSQNPFLVELFTPTCFPCKTLLPILNMFAEANREYIDCYKINVEANKDVANELEISTVPVVLFVLPVGPNREPTIVSRMPGVFSADALNKEWDELNERYDW